MKKIIHYIDNAFYSKFIIAQTECKKQWQNVEEFTSDIKYVTCKKCLNKLNEK